MFPLVEELRDKLKKEYPILSGLDQKSKGISIKSLSVESNPVRSTITLPEIMNMLQHSSLHKSIKDIDYGPLPKNPIPFKVKVQKYEAETSLNCFMKHIATKSLEKNMMERMPGFRKSTLINVTLPEDRKKIRKKTKKQDLNLENLEVFGQKEIANKNPSSQERNLKVIESDIKKNIKK